MLVDRPSVQESKKEATVKTSWKRPGLNVDRFARFEVGQPGQAG